MPALTRRAIPVSAKKLGWSATAMCTLARRRIRTRYPQPAQEVALSNQYWVCSSVQPGDSEARGGHHTLAGTNDDMLAASAETHRVINRPKAKAERIAIAPIDLPPFCADCTARLTRRERSQYRTARGRAIWDRFSGRLWGLEEKLPAIDHVVRAAITPSCSGFTIGQIGGIMGACQPTALRK
jgi:hypothetical protein